MENKNIGAIINIVFAVILLILIIYKFYIEIHG